MFLKISENFQENKKMLWHRCFLVNFAKFLRTPPVTASDNSILTDVLRNLAVIAKHDQMVLI